MTRTNILKWIAQETYYGCYRDQRLPRALPHEISRSYSVDACMTVCRKDGYTFAGLQYGDECWCGKESYNKYGIVYSCYNDLSKKCEKDAVNVCGGAWANSVFKVCVGNFYGRDCVQENRACGNRGADVSGECLSRCSPGWTGDACDQECPIDKFGPDCKGNCTDRCVNSTCDSKIGYCLDGCKAGFSGPFCLTSCQGSSKPTGLCPFCGHCKDSVCAGSGGDCYYQCPRNWEGDVCQDCDYDLWGPRCENKCSVNCVSSCDAKNGHCFGGCKLGYHGDKCEKACPTYCPNNQCTQEDGYCLSCAIGIYGLTCDKPCGNCSHEGCSFPGGECNGCIPGYFSANCDQPCPEGCTVEGCDQTTGACMNCSPGYFGDTCKNLCPSTCDNCERVLGKCISCTPGNYGNYCDQPCGFCSAGQCNMTDGICSPCVVGFYGETCNITCPTDCYNSECGDDLGDRNGCDQSSGSCLACREGYFGDVCNLTCPHNCVKNICDKNTGTCIGGCKLGFNGDVECSNCFKDLCDNNGKCLLGCKSGFTGLNCDTGIALK